MRACPGWSRDARRGTWPPKVSRCLDGTGFRRAPAAPSGRGRRPDMGPLAVRAGTFADAMDASDPISRFAELVRADEFGRLDLAIGLIGQAFDRRAAADDVARELDGLAEGVEPTFEGIAAGLFGSGL